jgi:hypothetical protein
MKVLWSYHSDYGAPEFLITDADWIPPDEWVSSQGHPVITQRCYRLGQKPSITFIPAESIEDGVAHLTDYYFLVLTNIHTNETYRSRYLYSFREAVSILERLRKESWETALAYAEHQL